MLISLLLSPSYFYQSQYSGDANSVKFEFQQHSNKITSNDRGSLRDEFDVLKRLTAERLEKISKTLAENEDQAAAQISQVRDQHEQLLNQINLNFKDSQLEVGLVDKKVNGIWSELEKIVSTFNLLSETVHKLLHYCTLHNHLSIQDEIDKQGMVTQPAD